jgi:thiamine-phosphate pyrophosphorylase
MLNQSPAARPRVLWETAQALNRRAAPGKALPPLLFVTDPMRTPDTQILAIAERLPEGAGVIYRAFGGASAGETARALKAIAARRGLKLLIGLDSGLARDCEADGVHLPERALHKAPELRSQCPHWLITGAAHSAEALRAAELAGLDAVLLSSVFPSPSPSSGPSLGVGDFTALRRTTALPVYALGGVNAHNAPLLAESGAAGLAAVEGVVAEYGRD